MKYLVLTLLLFSCGIDLRQDKPVEVNVNHRIDLYQVEKYFETICRNDNPAFNDEQVFECVDEYMADFIESLGDKL